METEKLKTKKEKDIVEWYNELLIKSEYVDTTAVKGCIAYRQPCFDLWEMMKKFLDEKLKLMGCRDVYFPMFIPNSLMRKEPEHWRVFSRELAFVTHTGETPLEEKLAIRPTSEMIIYDTMKKWIKSYKDLPYFVNQFCSVVRWETFKENFLLIRGNEFLWQESHSVHATEDQAKEYAEAVLEIYRELVEDYLAIPVFTGHKPPHRLFPGAKETLGLECLMPDCKSVQIATSHNLGQNFSKALDFKIENIAEQMQYVWQACNGITTRTIGALIMFHGDDNGVVLPPKIAPVQCAVLGKELGALALKLEQQDVRVKLDDGKYISNEEKISKYTMQGVPVIIYVQDKGYALQRRDTMEKINFANENELALEIPQILGAIQQNMFERAQKFKSEYTFETDDKEKFQRLLRTHAGMVKAPWCGVPDCARQVKKDTQGSLRLITALQEKGKKCINCEKEAKFEGIFAEAY